MDAKSGKPIQGKKITPIRHIGIGKRKSFAKPFRPTEKQKKSQRHEEKKKLGDKKRDIKRRHSVVSNFLAVFHSFRGIS